MSHKRTEIRQALVALLLNNTGATDRVFSNRVRAYDSKKFPAIAVFDESEAATVRDMAGRNYLRKLLTKIEVVTEGKGNYDEIIDNLALEIETIVSANPKISGKAQGVIYQGTELTFEQSGAGIICAATLTYEITYLT